MSASMQASAHGQLRLDCTKSNFTDRMDQTGTRGKRADWSSKLDPSCGPRGFPDPRLRVCG
jgi:hypothetical protein